jgi:hypothetical protein
VPDDRNNVNFKRIRSAMELTPDEVSAALAVIGVTVPADRVRRWGRSIEAGTGRYAPMSDLEFDQFCEGVSTWCYQQRQWGNP